jgi:choline dehydrogenase
MRRDHKAVVDGRLKVYGVDRLRIADASVMPRVPLGKTMAPCIIIGEPVGRTIARERHL